MAERFAIYYAPREGSPLDVFGRHWLGRDAAGRPISAAGAFAGCLGELRDTQIAGPRGYGFHGTLKAPFRLADGATAGALRDSVAEFARGRETFEAQLHLATLGSFVALRPSGPCPGLTHLANDCVAWFERYRAPSTEADLARRRAAGLSSRQQDYLRQWGYPYVFEEFRFHLTLTDPIPDVVQRTRILEALWPILSPICAMPVIVGDVCLFRQEAPGSMFVLDQRFPFSA